LLSDLGSLFLGEFDVFGLQLPHFGLGLGIPLLLLLFLLLQFAFDIRQTA
jgi:hypothetical protein